MYRGLRRSLLRLRRARFAKKTRARIEGYDEKRRVVGESFDEAFYLRRNPDVAEAGIDPLDHFLSYGWREGRDPGPHFSTRSYLEVNPDVAEAGVNPFWHYLVAGKAEGRDLRPAGGWKLARLAGLTGLEEEVADWRRGVETREPRDDGDLSGWVRARLKDGRRVIVAVTHDHYHAVSGGVQLCIQTEEAAAREAGWSYLSLHPWQPLPRLAHAGEEGECRQFVIADGEEIGPVPFAALVAAIERLAGEGIRIDVVIHHLLGQSSELIAGLIGATGSTRCWYWLHDYFSICPGYTLLRNTITYCGAPPPGSDACGICRYGEERSEHVRRMQRFFAGHAVHVIAPSEVARDIWLDRSGLAHASISVAPHAGLIRAGRGPEPDRPDEDSDAELPIRIGYIGSIQSSKGWPIFLDLFRDLGPDSGIEFHYFGLSEVPEGITPHQVHVTRSTPTAMSDVIAAAGIDIVLHWASWPETFSFSTVEAIAGGAFVITNPGSGNVARIVEHEGAGVVLADTATLKEFLTGPQGWKLVLSARARRRDHLATISLSRMALPLLEGEMAR